MSNDKSRIKNVLNYKKPSFWIVILAFVILIALILLFGTDAKNAASNNEPYIFNGVTSTQVGNAYFITEDKPETKQEELVYLYFLYSVDKEFDKKYEIFADIEANKISIENEKKNTDPEIYTSYVLHNISTLDKKYQESERSVTDGVAKQYNLTDFEIINAVYTQKHSDKLLSLGPQWGDGTMSRNFIVGKNKTDKTYKIYEFLMPNDVSEGTEINSAILSKEIHLYAYENYELTAERSIVDTRSIVNTILALSSRSETTKQASGDIPTVPNYIKIDINNNQENNKINETYFVYEINSAYYVEKPHVYINEITFDNYRDILNLSRIGEVPSPVSISAVISKVTDVEYDSIGTQGIENPQKDDFRKFAFKLYIEYPYNIKNRKVVLPNLYILPDNDGQNRYWFGNSGSQDNEGEPFAEYFEYITMYVRGLDESKLKEIFNSQEVNISWTDSNGSFNEFSYNLGDLIVFKDGNSNIIGSQELDAIGFFKNLISNDTFELIASDNTIKLTEVFSKYCNERGLGILFGNRVVLKNYNYITENYILSFENLNVELLEETSDENTIYRDYKISYTYIDKDKKKYELVDYYRINIKDNKIDYIKLDDKKSSIAL